MPCIHQAIRAATALLIGLLLLQTRADAQHGEVQCFRPTEEDTAAPLQLNEAVSLTQCHLKCVKKHINETLALRMAMQEGQTWPHLSTADLLAYRNCDILEKVVECRRGCFIRSQNPLMNRSVCRAQCLSDCESECGSDESCDHYSGTTCPLACKTKVCGRGCIMALEQPPESGSIPYTPESPFTLTRVETSSRPLAAGLYNVSITEESGGAGRRGSGLNCFVTRVETNGSSYYYPLTSLGDVFDVGRFACDTVNITFAAVNQYGVSEFSPTLEVTIYGKTVFPTQLPRNSLQYEWEEDTRPDYEGLAIVNMTWERQEGYEYISSYEISVFSQTDECGGEMILLRFDGIGKEATYFVWMSMMNYQMPAIHCKYQVQIKALPCVGEICKVPIQFINVDFGSMKEYAHPVMNLTCLKYTNKTTGIISVFAQWEVENTSSMIETIKSYQILTALMDVHGDIPRLLKSYSGPKLPLTEWRMAYLVHGISPETDEYNKIIVRVTPEIEEAYNWRPIPDRQECLVNVYPREPSVPSASVSEFYVNETRVFMNLSLLAPDTPYGDIESYEVVLVREPVPVGEDAFSLNLVRRTEIELVNGNQNGILNAENVNSAYQYIDKNTLCLYFHIRARNEFLWSGWSEAIVLERYPSLYNNCSTLQEPQNEIGLYSYIVAGVGIAVVAVVSILGLFAVHTVYKRYRMRKDMNLAFKDPGYENPIFRRHETKRRSSSLWLPMDAPKADDWELPSTNILLTEEEPLGEGCFGMVHRGVVKGPILHSRMMKNTICMNVAIKFLKKTATGSERSDFLSEIDTMKQVAEGNNPHVVNMIGCVTLQEPVCLVTEFVKYGDLLTYLSTVRRMMTVPSEASPDASNNDKDTDLCAVKEHQPLDPNLPSPGTQYSSYDKLNPYANLGDLEPVNLISFAYQIASGMEFLSSLGIVHRDLACRNILVGEGKDLKISDFGMARATVDEVYVKSTKGRLPWKWMAIESIMSREFTSASDVWAYGVTLWEIGTLGGFPYPTIANGDLLEYLGKGNRLECPTNCSREIYDIMQKCWKETPDKRPTFSSLKTMFAEMLQESNPYIQLDNINTHKAYYANPNTLDNGNVVPVNQSDDRSSIADNTQYLSSASATSSSSSSSASTPMESSSYELLKGNAGEGGATSLEDQPPPPPLVPPNLYVDTPTKTYEHESVFTSEPSEHPSRPTRLFLNTSTDINETDV